jgi:hypothetical protein
MKDTGSSLTIIETGIALIVLCSIPAASGFAKQLGRRDVKQDTYEDEDGKATPESIKAYSAKLPKTLVLLSAAGGCAVSIAHLLLPLRADIFPLLNVLLGIAAWVSQRTIDSSLHFAGALTHPTDSFAAPGCGHSFKQELSSGL